MTYNDNGYVPRSGYDDQFAPAVRWSKLFGGWKMDEASNLTRVDVLGNHDLSDVNTDVTAVTGKVEGNAIRIDTSYPNNQLKITTEDFRRTGDFTICFWIRPRAAWIADTLLALETAGFATTWRVRSAVTPLLEFTYHNTSTGNTVAFSGATVVDTWYFCTAVWDGTLRRVRTGVNGSTFVNGSALTPTIREDSDHMMIRRTGATTDFEMDALYYFIEAKDDAWALDMYNGGAGRSYPG